MKFLLKSVTETKTSVIARHNLEAPSSYNPGLQATPEQRAQMSWSKVREYARNKELAAEETRTNASGGMDDKISHRYQRLSRQDDERLAMQQARYGKFGSTYEFLATEDRGRATEYLRAMSYRAVAKPARASEVFAYGKAADRVRARQTNIYINEHHRRESFIHGQETLDHMSVGMFVALQADARGVQLSSDLLDALLADTDVLPATELFKQWHQPDRVYEMATKVFFRIQEQKHQYETRYARKQTRQETQNLASSINSSESISQKPMTVAQYASYLAASRGLEITKQQYRILRLIPGKHSLATYQNSPTLKAANPADPVEWICNTLGSRKKMSVDQYLQYAYTHGRDGGKQLREYMLDNYYQTSPQATYSVVDLVSTEMNFERQQEFASNQHISNVLVSSFETRTS